MAETNTRQAKRTPVTLKIKFKSATLDQFIERYSVDVSHGGIFIRTKDPLAVGTTLKFEFQLKDATPLIRGEGTVVWTREHDPTRAGVAPGMGVRFDRLPADSQEVLDQILSQKASQSAAPKRPASGGDGSPFSDGPTRVAPSPLVAGLKTASQSDQAPQKSTLMGMAPPAGGFGDERTDATPLPSPVPFHSDADDFPDEAFQEETRVAALDRDLLEKLRRDDDDRPEARSQDSAAGAISNADEAARAEPSGTDASAPADSAEPPSSRDEPADRPAAAAADELAAMDDELAAMDDELAPEDLAEDLADEAADQAEWPDEPAAVAAAGEPALPDELAARREDRGTGHREKTDRVARDVVVADAADDWNQPASSTGAALAIVAALLLVVGGGAYYYVFVMGDQAEVATAPGAGELAPASGPVTEAIPAEDPLEAAPPEQPPPTPAGIQLAVASDPTGATARLVGTDQSGITPVTFSELEDGKEYEVELQLEGYAATTVTMSSGQPLANPVALEALPRVLKVSTTPPGAQVFVNGRRQRGTTPLEIALEGALARADQVSISVRKRGFLPGEESVASDGAFVESEGVMAREVSLALEPKPAPVARTQRPRPARDEPSKPAVAESKPPKPAAKPSPVDDPAPEPKPEPTVAAKPEPEPEPEPKPAAKPKAKPASDAPPEPVDEGPVPDWMK